MEDWGREPFAITDYVVEPRRNLVTGPSGAVSLQPKMMDLLCVLANSGGEVVSRGELIDRIWGVEFGADESLTRAISQLRKAFDDSREQPRIIETIAKRGYRLVPTPRKLSETPVPREVVSSRPTRGQLGLAGAGLAVLLLGLLLLPSFWPKSEDPAPIISERTGLVVAVGPFRSEEAGSADGFVQRIGAEIARSPLVRVKAGRAGVVRGEQTIEYQLRGQVRATANGREINAQLLDVATGEVIWGADYRIADDQGAEGEGRAVSRIAAESLLPLIRSAKGKLLRLPIRSLEPWALALLVTWVPGDETRPTGPPHEDSYWLQRRALELDPNFAPAHALFAELAAYHALFHPPANAPSAIARARRHAARAIELAPYDTEVLYQLGLYHRFAGNRQQAEALFARVIELQPSHPLAKLDLAFVRGQCSDAAETSIAQIEREAANLSPSDPVRWVALAHLANLHLTRGDHVAARDAALRARQIVPITWTAMTLAAAQAGLGREKEALAVLAEHRREWPQMDVAYFAGQLVPRWCLGGSRTQATQQAFRQLAVAAGPRRERNQKKIS